MADFLDLIKQLDGRIERQRVEGGSILDYGTPDPLDVSLRDLLASTPRIAPPSSLKPTPPNTPEEEVLEDAAWRASYDKDTPEWVREVIKRLWFEVVARQTGVLVLGPAKALVDRLDGRGAEGFLGETFTDLKDALNGKI